jgi:hypothetical protein
MEKRTTGPMMNGAKTRAGEKKRSGELAQPQFPVVDSTR